MYYLSFSEGFFGPNAKENFFFNLVSYWSSLATKEFDLNTYHNGLMASFEKIPLGKFPPLMCFFKKKRLGHLKRVRARFDETLQGL
jgi:hypothetical protein